MKTMALNFKDKRLVGYSTMTFRLYEDVLINNEALNNPMMEKEDKS